MRYIPRRYDAPLKKLLSQFPVVCLLGPRQCGKTTFAKKHLSQWKYFDLEKPSHLAQVGDDPEGLLNRYRKNIVFDEAQHFPGLFPVLRSFVDENPGQKGSVVLLGSASPHLIRNISESLAGRVGFLDISPFHIDEVDHESTLWLRGGFPNAYLAKTNERRINWFEAYTRTFIERDLNLYGVEVNPSQMRRLWMMLAHMHGGILNASELANSLGISYHTANRYIDILEQTFLVRRLRPYYVNIGKRLVKSPKLYLRDSGLLHYFLNIVTGEELNAHPKRGGSWEGFVIEQIIERSHLVYRGAEFYFWQTSTKQEADLLIKMGGQIYPIEIKLHTAPRRSDVKGLFLCMQDLKLKRGYVIRPEGESYTLGDGVEVVSLKDLFKRIQTILHRGGG